MRSGAVAWLICSAICFVSLANGQLLMSAYFLVLTCILPPYVASQLRRRRL